MKTMIRTNPITVPVGTTVVHVNGKPTQVKLIAKQQPKEETNVMDQPLWTSENGKWILDIDSGKVYLQDATKFAFEVRKIEGLGFEYLTQLKIPAYVQKAVAKHWPYDLLATTEKVELQGVVYEKKPVEGDLNGKLAMIKLERFRKDMREEFVDPWKRFVRITGGFGCKPDAIGTAVYVTFFDDDEHSRWNYQDFECLLEPKNPLEACIKCVNPSPVLVQGYCPDCVNNGALTNVNI